MKCPNPLTEEHCNALNVLLQSIAQTKELIQACKNCSLPVEEQEAKNAFQEEVALAIKRTFFPLNS